MSIHRNDPKVFFPWERRRGLRSVFRRARARQGLLIGLALVTFTVVSQRERRAAEVRSTRATITMAINAIAAFRADHDAACPAALTDLVSGGYLTELPRDAWGKPVRVTCPGRDALRSFDVSSDGPDGEPAGLDRVE